jgi:hypothetical protein
MAVRLKEGRHPQASNLPKLKDGPSAGALIKRLNVFFFFQCIILYIPRTRLLALESDVELQWAVGSGHTRETNQSLDPRSIPIKPITNHQPPITAGVYPFDSGVLVPVLTEEREMHGGQSTKTRHTSQEAAQRQCQAHTVIRLTPSCWDRHDTKKISKFGAESPPPPLPPGG